MLPDVGDKHAQWLCQKSLIIGGSAGARSSHPGSGRDRVPYGTGKTLQIRAPAYGAVNIA
jgi:hypothetical protein